jgi:hypothetical protein
MVLTRLTHQRIFHQEAQRLSCIDISIELSPPTELSDHPIVYRPIFLSTMDEQFMNLVLKEQIKTIIKFSGSANEDVLKWLKDVEEIFDRAQLQSSHKYLAIQSYLIGSAAKWFRFNKANIDDWSTFKTALVKAYQPALEQTLLQLEQRKQSLGESVMEYYHDKINLCLQADPNMSSSMIIHYLTKGLDTYLISHVVRRRPATPNDFLLIAQDEEKIQITLNGLSNSSTSSTNNYPNDDTHSDDMIALVKQPLNRNTRSFNSPPHSSSPRPLMDLSPVPYQSPSSTRRPHYQSSSSSSTSRQCYNCHRVGHLAKYCPNRKNV